MDHSCRADSKVSNHPTGLVSTLNFQEVYPGEQYEKRCPAIIFYLQKQSTQLAAASRLGVGERGCPGNTCDGQLLATVKQTVTMQWPPLCARHGIKHLHQYFVSCSNIYYYSYLPRKKLKFWQASHNCPWSHRAQAFGPRF